MDFDEQALRALAELEKTVNMKVSKNDLKRLVEDKLWCLRLISLFQFRCGFP
jgi:hypothetical protein